MKSMARSKREEVSDILIGKLQSGAYAIGSQFASENELTKELGICKGTLREALSSLLDDGMLERRSGIGTFVRSHVPVKAENMSNSQRICLVEERQGGKRRSMLELLTLDALHSVFDSRNCQIRTLHPQEDESIGQVIGRMIREERPAVAVLVGFSYFRELTDRIRQAGIRLGCIGQPEDTENVSYVDTDHYNGMRRVIEYLVAKGHTRIALIDNSVGHNYNFMQRRNAYLDVLTEHGIIPDLRLFVDIMTPGEREGEVARQAFRELRNRQCGFSALVGYGSLFGGLWKEIQSEGIAVPGELSTVMYGGGAKSSYPLPWAECTYCGWDIYPMARSLAEMLLNSSAKHESLFPVEFHKGATVQTLSAVPVTE